jgi:hypothetical protein
MKIVKKAIKVTMEAMPPHRQDLHSLPSNAQI